MRLSILFCVLFMFQASGQDSIVTSYPSGVIRSVEYRGELMRARRAQNKPVRIVYNENSTLHCEMYYEVGKPKRRIWYENNLPVFGSSGHCHNYFFEKGQLIKKTTVNRLTRTPVNCEERRNAQQYSVERGTFKNFILHEGVIEYYTKNDELITTISVKNGYRKNDGVIHFSDSSLFRQIRNMPNRVDLNSNFHIELSEASCIVHLEIPNYVKDFSALRHFPNLGSLDYYGNHFVVAEYPSLSALLTTLAKTKRKPIGWRGDFDDVSRIHIHPPSCACASSDELPLETVEEVHEFVDEEAQFEGGYEAILEWFEVNSKVCEYYSIPIDTLNQQKVYVSFVVEMDGRISSAQIRRGYNRPVDLEVLNLIKLMPRWKPVKLNGRKVRSRMILPIPVQSINRVKRNASSSQKDEPPILDLK